MGAAGTVGKFVAPYAASGMKKGGGWAVTIGLLLSVGAGVMLASGLHKKFGKKEEAP